MRRSPRTQLLFFSRPAIVKRALGTISRIPEMPPGSVKDFKTNAPQRCDKNVHLTYTVEIFCAFPRNPQVIQLSAHMADDMKNADQLSLFKFVNDLHILGIRLWTDGNKISYLAPKGTMNEEFARTIHDHKEELIEYLNKSTNTLREKTRNIILLQDGIQNRSIFCVHAIDGGVGAYVDLANELKSGARIYGITAVDFQTREYIPNSIPEIGELYASQIVEAAKGSAYSLVGWSSGGFVAYETACALNRLGHEVRSLTMLDAGIPGPNPESALPQICADMSLPPDLELSARQWWRFLSLFVARGTSSIDLSFWRMDEDEKLKYIIRNRNNDLVFLQKLHISQAKNKDDITYIRNTVNINHGAVAKYSPTLYSGDATLYIATPPSLQDDIKEKFISHCGDYWSGKIRGKTTINRLTGGHLSVVNYPNIVDISRDIISRQ